MFDFFGIDIGWFDFGKFGSLILYQKTFLT